MRGRKPTPDRLKRLRGNPGKRRLPKADEIIEPRPDPFMQAPDHLNDEARAEWARVTAEFRAVGLLTVLDRAALAAYCVVYARWCKAERMTAKTSEVVATPNGSVQQSPWVSISNRSLDLMLKFMSEFGMTPASRPRLGRVVQTLPSDPSTDGAPASAAGDELDQFLQRAAASRVH